MKNKTLNSKSRTFKEPKLPNIQIPLNLTMTARVDSRWRRSLLAEARPAAKRNPPTRRSHSHGYGPSEIAMVGKLRSRTFSRTRSPFRLANRIPISRYHHPRNSPVPLSPRFNRTLAPPRFNRTWHTEYFRRDRVPRARIWPPCPRLAPNDGPQDRAPPARSERKIWRIRAVHLDLPNPTQVTATEASAEHPPLNGDKQDNYGSSNISRRPMTYAHVVARGQTDRTKITQDEWMTRRQNHTSRRPVDPRKGG